MLNTKVKFDDDGEVSIKLMPLLIMFYLWINFSPKMDDCYNIFKNVINIYSCLYTHTHSCLLKHKNTHHCSQCLFFYDDIHYTDVYYSIFQHLTAASALPLSSTATTQHLLHLSHIHTNANISFTYLTRQTASYSNNFQLSFSSLVIEDLQSGSVTFLTHALFYILFTQIITINKDNTF